MSERRARECETFLQSRMGAGETLVFLRLTEYEASVVIGALGDRAASEPTDTVAADTLAAAVADQVA